MRMRMTMKRWKTREAALVIVLEDPPFKESYTHHVRHEGSGFTTFHDRPHGYTTAL